MISRGPRRDRIGPLTPGKRSTSRPVKLPTPTETKVHRQIAGHVNKYGFEGNYVAFSVRNEQATASQRRKAIESGILRGMTDWVVLGADNPIVIELKKLGWKARIERTATYTEHEARQLAIQARLRLAGCYVHVAETLDEFIEILALHGIRFRSVPLSTERFIRGIQKALEDV